MRKIKKQKKMENEVLIYAKPSLLKRVWFWLTCWRPITKYEFTQLKGNLITILEGMREGDLQHYTTERQIIEEMKRIVEMKIQNKNDKDDSGMFN